MSIAKKGSRRIIVDSTSYRWSVRRQPTYIQALASTGLSFADDAESNGRSTLVVRTDAACPDNWLGMQARAMTPSVVEYAIRQALTQGWHPCTCGSAFELTVRFV